MGVTPQLEELQAMTKNAPIGTVDHWTYRNGYYEILKRCAVCKAEHWRRRDRLPNFCSSKCRQAALRLRRRYKRLQAELADAEHAVYEIYGTAPVP